MAIVLTKNTFVSKGVQSVAMSQFLSVTNVGDNPAYLIVSGLDRNEYTAGGTGATGTLTGNGAKASFTQQGTGDQREVSVVFAWNATTKSYTNATYGSLMNLTYNTSGSPNDLAALSFFGTNNAAYTTQSLDGMAANPSIWSDYGTATFATQSVGTAATTQATPDSICSAAMKFVGDVWNVDGCWVLANTIATEAGAALPVTSNYLEIPGVSNGEWKVAYNGPVAASASWKSMVQAGDVVDFVNAFGGTGHVTTVVSGQGVSAMVVDNVGVSANDGAASDLVVEAPHAGSGEFGAALPATVVVYRLDTPTVAAVMPSENLGYNTRQLLGSILSCSDWAGTAITEYQVYDSSSLDSLVVKGVGTTTLTSAANAADVGSLSDVSLLTGNVADADTIMVRAKNADGYWGDWGSALVNVVGMANVPAPTLASQTGMQTWITGHMLSFALPIGTFADPHGTVLTYTATQANGAPLPSWLTINAATGALSGTMPNTAQSLNLTVTATDAYGQSASDNFTAVVRPPAAPTVATPIQTQIGLLGKVFFFEIPTNAFTDPQGDVLTYSATQSDGSALPSWLTFHKSTDAVYNPASAALSATAAPSTPTTVGIRVTATDTDGLSVSETFQIVDRAPQAPLLATQTPAQTAYKGHAFSFTIPDGDFVDGNGNAANNSTLNYKATLADGTPLPSWLSFDGGHGRFWGTPSATAQTLNIKVTAFDGGSETSTNAIVPALTTSENFVINVHPGSPVVLSQPPSETIRAHFGFIFSEGVFFSDPQGGQLAYAATLADGTALPSWLMFDPATGNFSGKAPDTAQTLNIVVTATNAAGSSSAPFTLTDPGLDIPTLTAQTATQSVQGGHALSVSIASAFTDRLGETLKYYAYNTTLPTWLRLDATTGVLSGTAPLSSQTLAIGVMATNTDGQIASETVTITDTGLDTPTLTAQTAAQSVYGGHSLAFSAASAFTDPNKEVLTYKATLASGAALPSWITFNPATRAFSGTAPNAAQSVSIQLTATNTDGRSASETVTITDTGLDTPTLTAQTVAQMTYEGQGFSLAIPANIFADAAGEALTLTATQSSGQALPSWLSFNAATRTFSGTAPKAASTTSVTLTATNTDKQSVSETWTLTDKADSVALATQTANQTWNCGQTVSFTVPTGTFVDAAGEKLTYAASQASGAALPTGLSFNTATGRLSGTAPVTPQTLGLKITATDTDGLASSETVMVFIKAAMPTVSNPTANQTLVDGHQLSLPLAGAFSDPQGSALTYAASEIGGASAVSWLHLDNGVLNGLAPATGSGALGIRVTATNAYGLSVSETFGLGYAPTGSSAPSALYNSTTPATEMLALHG